jgi:hypothetical protein
MTRYYRLAIHENTVKAQTSASGKAIWLTKAGGYTSANDIRLWFPLSQLVVGRPNECGWCEILMPMWLVDQKAGDYRRLRETEVWNGEEYIIER